jgi:hypothetical protein
VAAVFFYLLATMTSMWGVLRGVEDAMSLVMLLSALVAIPLDRPDPIKDGIRGRQR